MTRYLTAHTQALEADSAAAELEAGLGPDLAPGESLAGGLLLATAASGTLADEVARRFVDQWPDAHWAGATFEGLVANGQIVRDEPALVVLAWTDGPHEPISFLAPPGLQDAASLEAEIMELAGGRALDADDLVLLFPDAVAAVQLDRVLGELGAMLSPAKLAGAAAAGIDGHPARVFFDGEAPEASLLGLFVPSPSLSPPQVSVEAPLDEARTRACGRVGCAEGTRAASPWLEVTACRERWVDGLDQEPALDWVRRQLGLDEDASIEPHLGRLLARVERRGLNGAPTKTEYEERYVVGVDNGRGAFAWPGSVSRGDLLALALPDAERAREALRNVIAELPDTPIVLQFACRARDASLHGDPDVESAWAAHHAKDAVVLGTVSPFQVVSGEDGAGRVVVHSSVLAGLGPRAEGKDFG